MASASERRALNAKAEQEIKTIPRDTWNSKDGGISGETRKKLDALLKKAGINKGIGPEQNTEIRRIITDGID